MGNRAILMSIQPQWVAKILNGEKTIEVRKKFLKDYVGWVYIYCTKAKPYLKQCEHYRVLSKTEIANKGYYLNGKVVAKFWCDKVEEIKYYPYGCTFYTDTVDTVISADNPVSSFEKASGLSYYDLSDYLYNGKDKVGYAIHISKLDVFDKPKELKEFRHTCKAEYRGYNRWQPCSKECKNCICNQIDDEGYSQCFSRLTKAPESWYYIEDK